MRVNDEDLKRLYREYLRERRPSGREDCPPVRDLMDLFGKKRRAKKGVIDHLSGCPFCADEFEFIQGLLKAEQELLDEIEPILKDEPEKKNPRGSEFRPGFLRKCIPYAVAAIVFGAVVGIFINKNLVWRGADSGKASSPIRMISPGTVARPRVPLKFQWEGSKKFDHCILELFDETLKPVWESPKIPRSELILPTEIREKLKPGRSYFWMITVVLEDGTRLESSLAKFSLQTN